MYIRRHFICKGRYPVTTIFASNSMLLVGVMFLILSFLEYSGYVTDKDIDRSDKFWVNIVISFGQSFAFAFCTLILYRTWLVYKKWNKSRKYSTKKTIHSPIPSDSDPSKSIEIDIYNIPVSNEENKIKESWINCDNILLFIIVIGWIFTSILYYFRTPLMKMIDPFVWIIVIICSIIIIFITWKCKEALSCTRECYMVMFILVGTMMC